VFSICLLNLGAEHISLEEETQVSFYFSSFADLDRGENWHKEKKSLTFPSVFPGSCNRTDLKTSG